MDWQYYHYLQSIKAIKNPTNKQIIEYNEYSTMIKQDAGKYKEIIIDHR